MSRHSITSKPTAYNTRFRLPTRASLEPVQGSPVQATDVTPDLDIPPPKSPGTFSNHAEYAESPYRDPTDDDDEIPSPSGQSALSDRETTLSSKSINIADSAGARASAMSAPNADQNEANRDKFAKSARSEPVKDSKRDANESRKMNTRRFGSGLGSNVSKEPERFDCGICLDAVNTPKLLPCMHSFCAHCLQQHIDSNTYRNMFRCPICRKELTKPKNGADGFEDNIYTDWTQGPDPRGNMVRCQACLERDGAQRCLECCQVYCFSCARAHLNMATSKSHHLNSTDSDDTPGRSDDTPGRMESKQFCEVHPRKKLSYYCEGCKTAVCGHCVIASHTGHTCQPVSQVAASYRDSLNGYLASEETGREFVNTLERQSAEIRKARNAFQNDVMNEMNKIEQQAERLKEKIDVATKVMADNLVERERGIVYRYDRASEDADQKLKWANLTVKTIEQIVSVAGDAEIVGRHEDMRDVLLDMKEQVSPTSFDHLEAKFIRNTPTIDELSNLIGCFEIKGPFNAEIKTTIELTPEGVLNTSIIALCPISDLEAWAIYGKMAQIVNKHGDKGHPIYIDDDVYDATTYSGGTVVLACKNSIKYLTEDQAVNKMFPLPGKPVGIAIISDKDIIVAFAETSAVTLYNIDGQILNQLNGIDDRRVIQQPKHISTNQHQDLFVHDVKTNTIAVLDSTGHLKTTIAPAGVLINAFQLDKDGSIYVTGTYGGVHQYKEDGHYNQTLVSARDKGGNVYTCVAIDWVGDVWLGDTKGAVMVVHDKAKK